MAMTVRYLTIDGEIVSETRSGVRNDYIPDPLGSTAALINSTHTITDTFLWWPFGEQRSHVGSSVSPFGYGGTLGYYTGSSGRNVCLPARTFGQRETCWLTKDPLWPFESAYIYSQNNPVNFVDELGMSPSRHPVTTRSSLNERLDLARLNDCRIAFALSTGNIMITARYMACARGSGCPPVSGKIASCLYDQLCKGKTKIELSDGYTCPQCDDSCGITFNNIGIVNLCKNNLGGSGCDHFNTGAPYHVVLLHEMLHRCGVDHPDWHNYPPEGKCNNIMACCMLKAYGLLPKKTKCQLDSERHPG